MADEEFVILQLAYSHGLEGSEWGFVKGSPVGTSHCGAGREWGFAKGLQTSSASQGTAASITTRTVFLVGCKRFLGNDNMSSLREAKGNANYTDGLPQHFSFKCSFRSRTGIRSQCWHCFIASECVGLCFVVITLCFLTLNLAQPFTPLFWRSESSQSDKNITDNIEPFMKSTEKHNVNLISKVSRSVRNTESTS